MTTRSIPVVLFVCEHNAGRSQLAAGLAHDRAKGEVTIASAGTNPDVAVSEAVLTSLGEVGIDRSDQVPQLVTDNLLRAADVVVALKPGLDLPQLDGVRYETWALPDPDGWNVDAIRPLREDLAQRVDQLIDQLT